MMQVWKSFAGGLLAAVALGACSLASRGPPGPVVSPTGIVYEPGTPPSETRFSQTAGLYLRSGNPARALELALEGVASDPTNPVHYFLAGVAHSRIEEYEDADRMFVEAQRIYPAYELDVEPERAAAWAESFNKGAEAYALGDFEAAVRSWKGATLMYDLRPEAHRNLAMLLSGEARYDEAIEVYERALSGLEKRPATRRVGEDELRQREQERTRTEESLAELLLIAGRFARAEPLLRRQLRSDPTDLRLRQSLALALSDLGRHEEAGEIYEALLAEEALPAAELINVGVALFRTGDYRRAAEAFGRLTELRPNSRDAWFNYANALFAAEAWDSLVSVGDRLLQLDPLGESSALIAARARLETGDGPAALQGVEVIGAAPVHVEGLVMRHTAGGTEIHGRVKGNRSEAGHPVRLLFAFYGDAGELGRETVTIPAPASGESAAFEVSFGKRAMAYRYKVVDTDR